MKTTQAWAWLAAGVLALGLNGFYQDGGAQWAHQIVDRVASRSGMVLALASGRADLFLSKAGLVTALTQTSSCRLAAVAAGLQSRAARRQADSARAEAMSAREEAALARSEANRARMESQLQRVRFVPAMSAMKLTVDCPRVRLNVPRIRVPRIDIPQIRVPEIDLPAPPVSMGAGPV
jgi:hypothetical protein